MAGGIPLKRANRAGQPARDIGRRFMMKKFLLMAAIGGLVFATSMAPAEAAPRRAADGTEAAAQPIHAQPQRFPRPEGQPAESQQQQQ